MESLKSEVEKQENELAVHKSTLEHSITQHNNYFKVWRHYAKYRHIETPRYKIFGRNQTRTLIGRLKSKISMTF